MIVILLPAIEYPRTRYRFRSSTCHGASMNSSRSVHPSNTEWP